MIELKSIEEEAAACREAWRGIDWEGTTAWHCHHEKLAESLTEPAENRIAYIIANKPEGEQALRLRLFRPVKSAALAPAQKAYDAALAPARKAYDAALAPAHAEECPGCPWNGATIFS